MHPNIEKIHSQHVDHVMQRMVRDLYGETLPFNATCAVTEQAVTFERRLDLDYHPIAEGDAWGMPWYSAWFNLNATVPQAWDGQEIALLFQVTGEALLFNKDGIPHYGFTGGSIFSEGYAKDRCLLGMARGGEPLNFWIEAAANQLNGLIRDYEPALVTKHPRGFLTPVIHQMRLAVFNRQVWQLLLDMHLLYDIMNGLPTEDYRRAQILNALHRAACAYRENPNNATDARNELKELLARPATASALNVYAVGHAHIDLGFLWPVRESVRKAARTYASQLKLMEDYPDYVFGASQPQLYQFLKDRYPKLYGKIKQRVEEGRWEPQGGMWVEADCNIISGESMVRQFLHGKNFFMDEFGLDVKNLWLPDVFGYSAALPQIIRKAGCDAFLTQKLSWSQVNDFPYETFWWQGLDGTKVLTHFPPEKTYNSFLQPNVMIRTQNSFKENAFLDKFISLFGIGDGGGGPFDEMLERLNRQKNLEYTPKLHCDTAAHFFQELAKDGDRLDTWVGELYLEFHRGTLTSQAHMKRWNRLNEQKLTATEQLLAQGTLNDYPQETLDRCWKKLLLNQFHDIIPGSSIHEVYETTEPEEQEIAQTCDDLQKNAAPRLFTPDPEAIALVNTLSCTYNGTIRLPQEWNNHQVRDHQNRTLDTQYGQDGARVPVTIPGNAFLTLRKGPPDEPTQQRQPSQPLVMENDLVRYEFAPDGQLISAFLKQAKRQILTAPGNVLTLYHDHPNTYEAWDIDIYYTQEKLQTIRAAKAARTAWGPVISELVFTYNFGQSVMTQTVTLTATSTRLDFNTDVDWQEARNLLRVAFPVDIQANEAQFDIQYGYVRRPTHDNTSWEQAKFEAVGHRYADLSDQQFGVAILNDCKYGYKVKGNTLDLALLRSPKHPDFDADRGHHQFTYAFFPHAGDAVNSQLIDEAACLNRAPLSFPGYSHDHRKPFCQLQAEDIALEVLKKAEKEDCRIIRLVETKGRTSTGILCFREPPQAVIETNLMEWENLEPQTVTDKCLPLTLKPFEIKTFKVW